MCDDKRLLGSSSPWQPKCTRVWMSYTQSCSVARSLCTCSKYHKRHARVWLWSECTASRKQPFCSSQSTLPIILCLHRRLVSRLNKAPGSNVGLIIGYLSVCFSVPPGRYTTFKQVTPTSLKYAPFAAVLHTIRCHITSAAEIAPFNLRPKKLKVKLSV
jgi:hypothetical protein